MPRLLLNTVLHPLHMYHGPVCFSASCLVRRASVVNEAVQ